VTVPSHERGTLTNDDALVEGAVNPLRPYPLHRGEVEAFLDGVT
jgi:hypothetical protein